MTITDSYKEIHALREKIAKLYDEYAGIPSERVRHMEEVAELQEEIERLQQLATQRGARMQIMRKWLSGIESGCLWESDDEWGALIEARPEAADWFDEDGVPK